MSQQDNKDNPKVEGMLRRWGAAESAGKVQPPQMRWGGGSPGWVGTAVRWAVPLAAAAAIIIAVGTWLAYHPASNSVADVRLQKQLATAQEENKKSWAAWHESQEQVQALTARATSAEFELKTLREKFKSGSDDTGGLRSQIAKMKKELDTQAVQLKSTEAALVAANANRPAASGPAHPAAPTVSDEVAALKEKVVKLEASVRNYDDRLGAAGTELERQKELTGELARKVLKAQDDLETAKAAVARQFEQAQAAYLSAAAPTEQGLRARQSASKRSRMVQRATALRKADRVHEAAPLLDRLEVVLTQLDMIDCNDPRAAQGFAKLLDKAALVLKIDDAMAAANSPAELRNFLAEARLILGGAENVG